jgi:two-component system, OmpR family, KDP operon response regulator KdpE
MKIARSHPLGNAARPITGFAGGKRLVLGPKEYLVRHAHHAGKVVTRQQVMKQVWGGSHLDDTHDLRIVVRKLRKTIEVDPTRPRSLLTELGIAYCLVQ